MKNNGKLTDEVSEPLEVIIGEVRQLSRSRRRQGTLLACLAILTALTAILTIRPDPIPAQPQKSPFLTFTDLDANKGIIFSDEDLLLPTKNNIATLDLPGVIVSPSVSGLQPREVFTPFDSVINASRDALMPPAFLPTISLTKPDDLLGEPFWKLTETFGQQASRLLPLPARGAAWRITLAGQLGPQNNASQAGETLMRGEWAETPGGVEFKDRRWDVALFAVLVNEVGILGEPLLERGTGIPDLDLFLAQAVSVDIPWAAMPPGYYRVSVAP